MKSIFLVVFVFSFIPFTVFAQPIGTNNEKVVDVSDSPLDQDNAAVAISRKDKNNIVIAAASDFDDMDNNGMPAYYTTDNGATWAGSRLPMPINPNFYIYGEPSIASDNAGNFFFAYRTGDGSEVADSAGNISIATSSDGGKTWINAKPINNNNQAFGHPEAPSITVDNLASSPNHGRVYVVWDQFFSAADSELTYGGVYIAWSNDKCKTWSVPKFLGASNDYQQVKTGKNGEIYVSCSDSLGVGHVLFVSTDAGATFTDPAHLISGFNSYPMFTIGLDSGYTGLKGFLGFAAFPYVSFDVDLKTNRIHAVYGDYQGDIAILYYSYSDNNGVTWSDAVGISDTSSSDRFDPYVSVDQKTGEVYVLFYSSEADPIGNVLTAPYRIRISDMQKQMLSPAFNPYSVEATDSTPAYIGDHTASDAFDSVYIGVWTQNRAGYKDGDVFAYISTPSTKNGITEPVMIHSQQYWLSSVYPNPGDGKNISLQYYLPHASSVHFDLYDATGKLLKQLIERHLAEGTYSENFSANTIAEGTYIIRMTTEESTLSQKIIIK
jgi:hypothetical protein